VANIFLLSLVVFFVYFSTLSHKTESQPTDQCRSSNSNQKLGSLHECQNADEYVLKLRLNEYCGISYSCPKQNELNVTDDLDDDVEYSSANNTESNVVLSSPLRVIRKFRWLIFNLIWIL
ncbi:hypothetical protein TorRG33x02_310450, partial [Trema orientale]